jgi:MerR family transcriptional regulator, light-induced transcriptional regulator
VTYDAPPPLPPVDTGAADDVPTSSLSPELLAGLLADGDDDLAAWTLRHALAEGTRAEVYDDLLAGAMALVGERWATGRWTVAEEHLASGTLIRALDRVAPDLGPNGRVGPLAVLAGVAGENHMIGLICLDHVLSEQGWTIARLGADVPAGDLASFAARNEAKLIALTASDPARLEAVKETVAAIRSAVGAVPVMLGGRLAGSRGLTASVGLDWSGTTLTGAAAFAASVLTAIPPEA